MRSRSFNMTGVAATGGPLAGGVNRCRAGSTASMMDDTIKSIVMTAGASMVSAPTEASTGAFTLAITGQSVQPWQSGSCDWDPAPLDTFIASAQSSGIAAAFIGSGFEGGEASAGPSVGDCGQKSAQAIAGLTASAAARTIAVMRRQAFMDLI